MIYQFCQCFVSLVLDVLAAAGVAANEKDLEIALLRQQLRVLERRAGPRNRLSRPEKLMVVSLADKLKGKTRHVQRRLRDCVR